MYNWILLLFMFMAVSATVLDGVTCEQNVTTFNIACDPNQQKFKGVQECTSKSLATIAASLKEQSNVQIDIKIPHLLLNGTVVFNNLKSLTINGDSAGRTTISCVDGDSSDDLDTGIIWSNITENISLNDLHVISCGSKFNINKDPNAGNFYNVYNIQRSSALTIVHSRNVKLDKVMIERSKGLGLTILDHQGGEVKIVSTVFKENRLLQEHCFMETSGNLFGGGGVYIELDYCPSSENLHKIFVFEDCRFYNNTALTNGCNRSVHNDLFSDKKERNGRGGGAYVLLKSGTSNVKILFLRCEFTGNQGLIGGGLSVNLLGESNRETTNITVMIRDSQFNNNGCGHNNSEQVRDICGASPKTGFGGGLQLTFNSFSETAVDDKCNAMISRGQYVVRNTTFTKNCAEVGGGLSYFSHCGRPASVTMLFDECTFEQNTAHMGSAVAMTPNRFSKLFRENIVTPCFQNCTITSNFIFDKCYRSFKDQRSKGIGTIYASLYNIDFQGSNVFVNNLGSAIYIVNGILNLTDSDVSFINNTGHQGGAVALIGASTMIVGPNKYEFFHNIAFHEGGAIYVFLIDKADFTISRSCFIKYTDYRKDLLQSEVWHANITFQGNKALNHTGGHAIYATSLHACQIGDSDFDNLSRQTLANISKLFFMHGVTLDDTDTLQPQIATDGAWLSATKPMPLAIIPGKEYHHGVKMFDDLGQKVDLSFKINIERETENVDIDPGYSTFIRRIVKLSGTAENNASLYLTPVSPRYNYVKLSVQLLDCPPGYKLNKKSQCTCNAQEHYGLIKCDNSKFQSYLMSGFWAGHINTSKLVTSECYFCVYSSSSSASSTSAYEVILPDSFSKLNYAVCGDTRTGVACGRCRENYTVHFHSPGFLCKPPEPVGCKLGWLFYILSELVPVTVVFIFVLVLNVSFTSGAVNGFILFSQLLGSLDIYAGGITVFSVTEKRKFDNATEGYKIMYGFFNLDLFNSESLSFCLWNGASTLDMIAFKYFTIIYTVLLVVAVIFVMNKCGGRCLGRCCRITTIKLSVIHGISTFLVICYAQCVKVSLNLLLPVHLHIEHNSSDPRPRPRVWFNGEVEHLSRQHWPYAIPAILTLLIIGLLPPALLLTYPTLNKVLVMFGLEERNPFNFISSISWLKPLLDSFQGCYKDNFRFFSGLYFLYRWSFLVIHWNTGNFSVYFTSTGGILLFMLTLHTICQPYIKRVHNIIDTLLLANLVLINSLSFFNYHKSRSQSLDYGATVTAASIQLVLIYLPLIVIGVYFLSILCEKVVKHGTENETFAKYFLPVRSRRLRKLIKTVSTQHDSLDSVNIVDEEFDHNRFQGSVEYHEF